MTRRTNLLALAAMAGALGVGASPAPAFTAPTTRTAPAPVREYVAPAKDRRTRRRRRKLKYRDPLRTQGRPWQHGKNGDAIDGRGDYRSAKRLLRQQMCAKYGITTGRQWVRLRRRLRDIATQAEARKAA